MPVERVLSVFGHLHKKNTRARRLKGGHYEIQIRPEFVSHIERIESESDGVFELKKENGDTLVVHTGRKTQKDSANDLTPIAKFHRDEKGNFFVTLLELKLHPEKQIQLANYLHLRAYPLDKHIMELKAAFGKVSDASRKNPFAAHGSVEKILHPLLVREFDEFAQNGLGKFYFEHNKTKVENGLTSFVFHGPPNSGKRTLLAVIINREKLMLLAPGEKDYEKALELAEYLLEFKNRGQTRQAFEELGETRVKNGKLATHLSDAVVNGIEAHHDDKKSRFKLEPAVNAIRVLHASDLDGGKKKMFTEIGEIKDNTFNADLAGNHEKLGVFSKYLLGLATRKN